MEILGSWIGWLDCRLRSGFVFGLRLELVCRLLVFRWVVGRGRDLCVEIVSLWDVKYDGE